MSDIQTEATRIYNEHKKVIEIWESGPDPIKSALAQTVKYFAGAENATSHS